ncbi:hypothetical protein Q4489_12890 [Thalassotalea sp. 1_MG-2023]|uniref:hypothetical protein n=1 Tax=Thalassotalea sp. 1_MG-2023 TaxID=3062680 RepID=UPI0026E45739|nr:hypothetical protein [Thalassotalea sp. 1_MG-2023]MDO6427918.1 hypothetical protein [Thalassotalea sp. 1_MG-2023]
MAGITQRKHYWANVFLCGSTFVALQLIKPMILMTIYREVYQFNPTLYTDWALYKLVWSTIQAGAMNAQVTIGILLGELVMLLPVYLLYRFLFSAQQQQSTA